MVNIKLSIEGICLTSFHAFSSHAFRCHAFGGHALGGHAFVTYHAFSPTINRVSHFDK